MNDSLFEQNENLLEVLNAETTESLNELQENLTEENGEFEGDDFMEALEDAVEEFTEQSGTINEYLEGLLNEDVEIDEDGVRVTEYSVENQETAGGFLSDFLNTLFDNNNDTTVSFSDYTLDAHQGAYGDYMIPERIDYNAFDELKDNEFIIGDPFEDMEHYHTQDAADTCAVVSQEFIIESLTGLELDEATLAEQAKEFGYTEGWGSTIPDVGLLAEQYGLESEFYEGSLELNDAIERINNGEKLVAFIDSSLMYYPDASPLPFFPVNEDHAVEITGFDVSDPNDIKVIINDPGIEEGAGNLYSWDYFMECTNGDFTSIHR